MKDRKTFNKLVRDKIPEIIRQSGEEPEIEILDDKIFLEFLNKKLLEECGEVTNALDIKSKIEELADLLEVVHAMAKALDVPVGEIENTRLKKKEKRGGFESKILLKTSFKIV